MEIGEWLKRYKARMIERGLNEREATSITEAVSTDLDIMQHLEDYVPEDAADDELSYFASDG